MKILGQVQIEDREAELIEFMGYEIPNHFSVLMWFSLETFNDPKGKNIFLEAPFGVKFSYEIGSEGTPNVVEVRIQGGQSEREDESNPFVNDFGIYEGIEFRGRVFRHNLGFVEKNFTDILITGLQFVIQKEYKKRDFTSGKQIEYITKRIDRSSLLAFEKKIREEVGKTRKLTPEFLNRILKERAKYKSLRGSHYGFNEYLAGKELVSVKAVEKWIAKAESSLINSQSKSSGKTKRVSATKAGKKKNEKVVKNGKPKSK
jgi:hypothetical protein